MSAKTSHFPPFLHGSGWQTDECLTGVIKRLALTHIPNRDHIIVRITNTTNNTNTNTFISGKNPYTIGTYISTSK